MPGERRRAPRLLVRYADDLVALCHSQEQAEQVKARLAEWLAPRGLVFNEDKTQIVHLDEGFDFLGFNVRRYHGKLLIKPSKAAVKRLRERLARRDARPARIERDGGHRQAQPDHPGLGGLLPGRGVVQRDVQRVGQSRVEAHLQVGQVHSPEQAEDTGSSPGTSASSTSSGTTGGCSATATAAPT